MPLTQARADRLNTNDSVIIQVSEGAGAHERAERTYGRRYVPTHCII